MFLREKKKNFLLYLCILLSLKDAFSQQQFLGDRRCGSWLDFEEKFFSSSVKYGDDHWPITCFRYDYRIEKHPTLVWPPNHSACVRFLGGNANSWTPLRSVLDWADLTVETEKDGESEAKSVIQESGQWNGFPTWDRVLPGRAYFHLPPSNVIS